MYFSIMLVVSSCLDIVEVGFVHVERWRHVLASYIGQRL